MGNTVEAKLGSFESPVVVKKFDELKDVESGNFIKIEDRIELRASEFDEFSPKRLVVTFVKNDDSESFSKVTYWDVPEYFQEFEKIWGWNKFVYKDDKPEMFFIKKYWRNK